MDYTANRAVLRGTLAELPVFSHENHDKRFFRFLLEVQRLSGTVDLLPVIVPETVMEELDPSGGSMIEVTGQVRSFNSRAATGRKLIISVYAETMAAVEGEAVNEIALTGVICKPPVYRRTPLGREICDVMLAVNRPYRRTDYLPCIFWGKTAAVVRQAEVGQTVNLTGRLQSRDYIKILEEGSEQRTAYEVSAITAELME